MENNRIIHLQDKVGKPGFSAFGGELLIEHHRKDGSTFIEKLEIEEKEGIPNLTTMAGGLVAAKKLLGLEVVNGLYTSANKMEAFATYKLDKDSKMNLLPTIRPLTNEIALCGFAFGKEGAESQARDIVRRYEKGWKSNDLLPILYYRTEAEDNIQQNFNAGYFLRSVENGTVRYYGLKTSFEFYGKIIGGNKFSNTYPADDLAGSTLGTDCCIEVKFDIVGEHFESYFIYDQLNAFSKRLKSFKILMGRPYECDAGGGNKVIDFRDIEVTNVVPTSVISLEKDEKVTIIYRMYL